jgi:hypothetical protein
MLINLRHVFFKTFVSLQPSFAYAPSLQGTPLQVRQSVTGSIHWWGEGRMDGGVVDGWMNGLDRRVVVLLHRTHVVSPLIIIQPHHPNLNNTQVGVGGPAMMCPSAPLPPYQMAPTSQQSQLTVPSQAAGAHGYSTAAYPPLAMEQGAGSASAAAASSYPAYAMEQACRARFLWDHHYNNDRHHHHHNNHNTHHHLHHHHHHHLHNNTNTTTTITTT